MLTLLKELRLRRNFKQADVEKKTQIPQPRYSRIERGVTKPTEAELNKIIKAFGLSETVIHR